MGSILIKNANAIVTVDNSDRVLRNMNIHIDNNKIAYIGDKLTKADETIDASEMFVFPGLVNTHHHLYQTFTRNIEGVQNMELFDWLTALYEIWKGLDPEMIYYSSLVGMGELLKYGCTTCFDHHYVFKREGSDGFIDTQFKAAEDIGMRFHASRGSMSRGKRDGGLPPDELVQDVDKIMYESERIVKKYHDGTPYSMSQVVLAPCSPFSVNSELMIESARLARSLGVRLHTHLAETRDEERFCLELFGLRPLEYMESLEWLGSDVWFAHGIHFSNDELKKLAATKTGVAHCPVSNMKLSSGTARLSEMIRMGIPVGLAVDGSASNDCSNLLAEIRMAYLLHRLTGSSRAPSGYDILKIATRGGADVLGRKDIGSVEEGKAADLFLINIRKLELAGALHDPKAMLAAVGYARPVDYTIVNGKVVVRDGRLCSIDELKTADTANRLVEKLLHHI